MTKMVWPPVGIFENTSCSQCGQEFGPGDHGYSHCIDHANSNSGDVPDDITEVAQRFALQIELSMLSTAGLVALIEDALLKERERCAQIAEKYPEGWEEADHITAFGLVGKGQDSAAREIAAKIRGEKL